MKRLSFFAAILALVTAAPAVAIVGQGPVWSATYVAAFEPALGLRGYPYSGIMKLTFNHGVISGTYDSTSVRPDPMFGRIIPVTGTTSKGSVILHVASLTMLNGTIDREGTIQGTATWQGRLYNFMAKVKSSP